MLTVRTFAWVALVGTATWVVACGDATPAADLQSQSMFEEPQSGDDDDDTKKGGNDGLTTGFGDDGVDGTVHTDAGRDGSGPSCSSATIEATRKPVKLVTALDQSGSMGLGDFGDPKLKWIPVTQAFASFLGDPKSKGIDASLLLFPRKAGGTETERIFNCNTANYTTPDVAMTALPNANAFTSKLPTIPPGLQTPTRAVLKALVADALKVQAANPNDAVAIVFMSDGDPIGCYAPAGTAQDEDIDVVAAEAKVAADAGVPVYVIGIGNVENLGKIAKQGGTNSAFIVPVNNAEQTKKEFLAAVDKVRTTQASCTLNLSTPSGRLDPTSATLTFTPGTGAPIDKAYDPTCAQGGFQFDDPKSPKKVTLCAALCDSLKADPDAKITLSIPCAAEEPK